MPGDEKQSGPPAAERPPQVPPGTEDRVSHQGDPRRVGELLGDWLAIRVEEVDDLVDEARSRVDALPDQRVMWSLIGEVIVLLRALELEVAELRKASRR